MRTKENVPSTESEATGTLKRLYDAARARAGYVANIIKINYINRIAEGLGVDPDAWMKLPPSGWQQRKARWTDICS